MRSTSLSQFFLFKSRIKNIFFILSLGVLTACGGDSANNDSSGNGGSKSNKISFDVKYENACGLINPYENVDIILHNEQGKAISTGKTNSAGHFEVEFPNDAKHLTIMAKNSYSLDNEFLSITSYLDVIAGEQGTFIFYKGDQSQSCNCKNVTVNLTELKAVYPDYLLGIGNETNTLLYRSDSVEIEVCNDEKVDAILVSPYSGSASAAYIDFSGIDKITLTGNEFTSQGDSFYVDDSLYNDLAYVRVLKDDDLRWFNYSFSENGTPLFVFSDLSSDNFVTIGSKTPIYLGNDEVSVRSRSRSRVQSNSAGTLKKVPDVSQEFTYAVEQLFVSMMNDNVSVTSYDFNNLDNGFNEIYISFNWKNSNNEAIRWSIKGALKGSIPDLDLGQTLMKKVEEPTDTMSFYFTLSGYGLDMDYATYRHKLQTTPSWSDRYKDTDFDNYRQIYFNIQNLTP
jgi:hypothetical protein